MRFHFAPFLNRSCCFVFQLKGSWSILIVYLYTLKQVSFDATKQKVMHQFLFKSDKNLSILFLLTENVWFNPCLMQHSLQITMNILQTYQLLDKPYPFLGFRWCFQTNPLKHHKPGERHFVRAA